MERIRLVQITHDLAIGGLQQVVVNICKSIDREKFDISVLCLRSLGDFASAVEQLGIRVYSLKPKNDDTQYLAFFQIAKFLREHRAQVIHTHNTQPLLDATPASLIAGRQTIIHTDHARDFPDKKRYMVAEWLMSHFVYRIVGVSEHTSKNLMKYERISADKIVTIPNGIDETTYDIEIDIDKKKGELGISAKAPVIGLGVRLTAQKGITYLLNAMPTVIRWFPAIALVIAGEGPLYNELQRETWALGIQDHVFFIGPRLDMPEVLKVFDLYVLPSVWEGLPMVLLEAMAAGCAIVATDVGGNRTPVQHGVNGSLVPAREPESLSAEIIRVLADRELRQGYVQEGRKMVSENFSARAMTRKYEELYLGEFLGGASSV